MSEFLQNLNRARQKIESAKTGSDQAATQAKPVAEDSTITYLVRENAPPGTMPDMAPYARETLKLWFQENIRPDPYGISEVWTGGVHRARGTTYRRGSLAEDFARWCRENQRPVPFIRGFGRAVEALCLAAGWDQVRLVKHCKIRLPLMRGVIILGRPAQRIV
jgi:hypothetical protein